MPTDRIANFLYVGSAALLIYAFLAWLVSLPVFALHHVEVRGELQHVNADGVRLVASRGVRGTFFTVELGDVRAAFEKLPWVREARVSRRWPDTLVVEMVEHTPFARWNGAELVSSEGEVFNASVAMDLPRLSGFEGSGREVVEAYRRYGELLAPLGMKIGELSLSPRRAWRLKTDSGLEIALGRTDIEPRLKRFAAQYRKLSERLGAAPAYVDLRYADGFAVKLPQGAQQLNKQS
jgi:cell division protein FtsQ